MVGRKTVRPAIMPVQTFRKAGTRVTPPWSRGVRGENRLATLAWERLARTTPAASRIPNYTSQLVLWPQKGTRKYHRTNSNPPVLFSLCLLCLFVAILLIPYAATLSASVGAARPRTDQATSFPQSAANLEEQEGHEEWNSTNKPGRRLALSLKSRVPLLHTLHGLTWCEDLECELSFRVT